MNKQKQLEKLWKDFIKYKEGICIGDSRTEYEIARNIMESIESSHNQNSTNNGK